MIFHTFIIGDSEDPDLYAAQPIWEWQQTDHGQWVMKHGHDLKYNIHPDIDTFGYKVFITGVLDPDDEIYYTLKYK